MKHYLKFILFSILCISALAGCSKEPKTNPTEPVNMAGALFILDETDFPIDEQYVQDVIQVFVPSDIESIVHDRLAESNFLSGEETFAGTHTYQLLVEENSLKNTSIPDYVYLWIEDLNILKKIYLIQDTLCDFNPKISMETECLDEAVGVIYDGSFTFEENAEFSYASKNQFEEQYQAFEEIVKTELPLLAREEPASITVYVAKGFPWELKAGSIKAFAHIQYENGSSDIYEIHLAYEKDGQAHMASQNIGKNIEDFPEIKKMLLYQYMIP